MSKISFVVEATDVVIKAQNYQEIRVELDGVELSDLVEDIDDNESILETIGISNIGEWINSRARISDILDELDTQEIAEYLERRGWKIQWGG
ncbi:hypothetical protein GYD59_001940 [Salmonella enterica]|nr:hypothetical protein [Salmonella enterica subsp. enterica]EDF8717949.1 hypothetical protein [Salmonella enterica]EEH2567239.1 hypothetical protein [Salmonella enterica]EHM3440597.1 hypothetical protein [Salmonella enterica subsp. enterica]EHW9181146.1 hypothetical protein [Salmonella enterica subsp. enterica]